MIDFVESFGEIEIYDIGFRSTVEISDNVVIVCQQLSKATSAFAETMLLLR